MATIKDNTQEILPREVKFWKDKADRQKKLLEEILEMVLTSDDSTCKEIENLLTMK